MNTKFIFTLSIVILSIILSVDAHCHKKRSLELFKRHDYQKNNTCPCTAATATFNSVVVGITTFAQDECGSTLVTGLFSDGLVDPEKNRYDFLIVDKCGNLLFNLTSALNIKFRNNGTFPFSTKIDDLNLDCDPDGILLAESDKKRYVKRATGADFEITQNGQSYAKAPISKA